jgi:Peptidase family M28
MIRMPGRTFSGPQPPFLPAEEKLASRLKKDVETLVGQIGPRNHLAYAKLLEAAAYIEARFLEAGYPEVLRETYVVSGMPYANLSVEIRGRSTPSEIVIIGGHYDSVAGCPGANDNASGTAAVLALAELFAMSTPARTVEGQLHRLRGKRRLRRPRPQGPPHIPRADTVSLRRRRGAQLHSGVGWSDHWSFWQEGYPAIMVTDTAPFRYPHYHTAADTPDRIDYLRCGRVVHGLHEVVAELSGCPAP